MMSYELLSGGLSICFLPCFFFPPFGILLYHSLTHALKQSEKENNLVKEKKNKKQKTKTKQEGRESQIFDNSPTISIIP